MHNFINFLKLILVRSIIFFQFIKHRILGRKFSKDRFELLKHNLNFYSFNLKERKALNVIEEYTYKSNIKGKYFRVDINKFTGFDGFYTFNGKAPLLKTAEELFNSPKIKVEESYLYRFYENFKPKNYGELYQLSTTNSLYKVSSFNQFKPWINSFIDHRFIRKGLFGPMEHNEIEHRLIRLRNIFMNINKFGYIPSYQDIIKGYILLSDNDYRFLITSGHHRVAVLKALNKIYPQKFRKVIVTFEKKRSNIKIVDQKKVDRWPAVLNNFCSKEDALELFDKYFNL